MSLIFCERCNNIMVLEKNLGKRGEYACRSCGLSKRMELQKLEIEEEVKALPITLENPFKKKELL